jgi:hypothetical protein
VRQVARAAQPAAEGEATRREATGAAARGRWPAIVPARALVLVLEPAGALARERAPVPRREEHGAPARQRPCKPA